MLTIGLTSDKIRFVKEFKVDQTQNPETQRTETIAQIHRVVASKLSNPEVVRQNPYVGLFILNDSEQNGHYSSTKIEIILNPNEDLTKAGKTITFIESFKESTPRNKPSVVSRRYELDGEEVILGISANEEDRGILAKNRLLELKSEGKFLETTEDGLAYLPSEAHLQKVLASLKEMKIYISSY